MGAGKGKFISYSNRKLLVGLIDEARQHGAKLKSACELLGLTDRTYQRWTLDGAITKDKRPYATRKAPQNKLSNQERTKLLSLLKSDEYAYLSPSQIVSKLLDKGEYIASESTIYRILREEKLYIPKLNPKLTLPYAVSKHIALAPNQVWAVEIVCLHRKYIGDLYYKLYLVIDIYSKKIVAYEVWEGENIGHIENLVQKAIITENVVSRPLLVHSKDLCHFKNATYLKTLQSLKLQNYSSNYPEEGFESLKQVRQWVKSFVLWYNKLHPHSRLNYITPYDRHLGKTGKILATRKKVYENARKKHPRRWTGNTKTWDAPDTLPPST